MISILICSVNPNYLQQVSENIRQTIGLDYELLVMDNRKENLPICQVYNQLASRAAHPYLLFLHEDVAFQTISWGPFLLAQFTNDTSVGVIGIAGSIYKSVVPSGWFTGLKKMDYFNILHDNKGVVKKIRDEHDDRIIAAEVKVLDGVFLACRKSLWQEIRFNEQLLHGFHFYDIDFSLRASFKYKNIVLRNLNMIHYTVGGDFGEPWVQAAFLFHHHYHHLLAGNDDSSSSHNDTIVFKSWLDLLKNEKIIFMSRIKWIWVQKKYISFLNLYSVFLFLMYRPLQLYRLHAFYKSVTHD
jgi:hypothetical protein